MSARTWTCRRCGSHEFRWLRNGRRHDGKPARKRTCATCRRPHTMTTRDATVCPRDGTSDWVEVLHPGNGSRYRRCRACIRRWGEEARRRDPAAMRERSRRYRIRMGLEEPPDGDLDADPWVTNWAALQAAMGRA